LDREALRIASAAAVFDLERDVPQPLELDESMKLTDTQMNQLMELK
jgi:hypothetical protein